VLFGGVGDAGGELGQVVRLAQEGVADRAQHRRGGAGRPGQDGGPAGMPGDMCRGLSQHLDHLGPRPDHMTALECGLGPLLDARCGRLIHLDLTVRAR
jgi:hypothetical protein